MKGNEGIDQAINEFLEDLKPYAFSKKFADWDFYDIAQVGSLRETLKKFNDGLLGKRRLDFDADLSDYASRFYIGTLEQIIKERKELVKEKPEIGETSVNLDEYLFPLKTMQEMRKNINESSQMVEHDDRQYKLDMDIERHYVDLLLGLGHGIVSCKMLLLEDPKGKNSEPLVKHLQFFEIFSSINIPVDTFNEACRKITDLYDKITKDKKPSKKSEVLFSEEDYIKAFDNIKGYADRFLPYIRQAAYLAHGFEFDLKNLLLNEFTDSRIQRMAKNIESTPLGENYNFKPQGAGVFAFKGRRG